MESQQPHIFDPSENEQAIAESATTPHVIDYLDMDVSDELSCKVERGEIVYYTNLGMFTALNPKDQSLQSIARHHNTGIAMAKQYGLPLPQRKVAVSDNAEVRTEEEHFAA